MPRKKKPPLDAATRERIDRFMQRHPPTIPQPVPDPSDIQFRHWVIGLAEDPLHTEVSPRLRERWPLIRDAFLFWDNDRHDAMRVATMRKLQDALASLRFPSLI